jgi:hypothetical protein
MKQLKKELKTESISIRITPSVKKWLKKSKNSPSFMFSEALRLWGYKNG